MSPVWNTPLTWQVDQLVTEADLNSQLRDNLRFLKDPPTDFIQPRRGTGLRLHQRRIRRC